MKYCTNCGAEMLLEQEFCTNCGAVATANLTTNSSTNEDQGGIGLAILGFFIPIVGLILFLSMRKTKPNVAKKIGIWSLVGFVINIIVLNM